MTKSDVKLAWGKVGDELSGLGLKLKYHVQEEFSDKADDDDGTEVKVALKRLADAIDDALDAAENAAKDPAVREDVKDAGRSLMDALTTTVNEAVTACRTATARNDSDSPIKPDSPPEPVTKSPSESSSN